jgi:hypothetical protein
VRCAVTVDKERRYQSSVWLNNAQLWLGTYDTIEQVRRHALCVCSPAVGMCASGTRRAVLRVRPGRGIALVPAYALWLCAVFLWSAGVANRAVSTACLACTARRAGSSRSRPGRSIPLAQWRHEVGTNLPPAARQLPSRCRSCA